VDVDVDVNVNVVIDAVVVAVVCLDALDDAVLPLCNREHG